MSNRINIFGYILIIFVAIVMLKIYIDSDMHNLKCIISTIDGNKYCVRERKKINLVADLLANCTVDMKRVVSNLYEKYPERDNVKRLKKNFKASQVKEILPTSVYTAYSENKGEKMAFCVTKKKRGNNLIDRNTLTFVALHELTHIMTVSIGHKKEFWDNFKFLLHHAVDMGIYEPVDYSKTPVEYCSMEINDNPYFS
uniref:Uncharacterized protein n=1 Tax=viral metagenome TaxID=1070528 RepID=A0A6C0KIR4_9ZZZZ